MPDADAQPAAGAADDNKNNDGVQDDPKEVKAGEHPTLDQVHELNQNKVENDDAENEDDSAGAGGDGTADDDKPKVDEDGKPTNDDDVVTDSGNKKTDSVEAGKDGGDKGGSGSDDTPKTPPEPADKPASELDTDITKNVKGKVAIKSLDGKTYYFNNLDEVPEDFEPTTYKELMRGVDALRDKRETDEKTAADAEQREQTEAQQRQINDMQTEWESDASDLTSAGLLPKDKTENTKAKEAVYDYIQSELEKFQKTNGKEGVIHTSFKAAFKAMEYDKQREKDANDQKTVNDAKKKRGAMVQPGGTAAPSTPSKGGGRTIQAPPPGTSLDAVHNNAVENL